MVWGHCGAPFHRFIYLFHMAIFFMASGFCSWNQRVNSGKHLVAGIKKKILRLYIPFVLFNISLVFFNNILVNNHIINSSFLNVSETIKELIKVFLFFQHSDLAGATWFIRILFFVSVVYALICYFSGKSKRIGQIIQGLLLFTCVVFAQYFSDNRFPDIFYYFVPFFAAFIAFYLGLLERIIIQKIQHQINMRLSFVIVIGSFAGLCLLYSVSEKEIEVASGQINNVLFYSIAALLGWNMLYFFSVIIHKLKIHSILVFLGQHTMSIVLFHFLAFKIISYLYLIIKNQSLIGLSVHPVIKDGWLWVPYLICGITIPILLSFIWTRIKMLFYDRRIKG